ncbi:MAG TPA: hypothetical protein VJ673_08115 [Aromatoleum sp.]|uniref:hypothetical protein n=1 Tax=Aromatoleum sp. TaxID=2307007 RepID=UPI002B4A466C|nr:hypothetical protein [Aromatoleum sp.]HJV25638.1 hypothetical protein [Aromatoleum sp.]
MRTNSKALILAALGTGILAATPATAADSTEWLLRQLSTEHRDGTSMSDTARSAMSAPVARGSDESGQAFATAWLDRQFTGKPMAFVSTEGVAGRTGPTERDMSTAPVSDAWLKHQFTTDHPSMAN